MLTISTKTKVKKDHKITLNIPPSVPIGEYDMLVVLSKESLRSTESLPITYATEPNVNALAVYGKVGVLL